MAGEKDANRKMDGGAKGGGQSGGGAYPNPHSGKDKGEKSGFLGSGGQSEMEYHGSGQLGEEKVGDNANATAGGKKPKA